MATDDQEPIPAAQPSVAEVERLLNERDHLIHELEVHQAELEAQNQQLRESQGLLEESRARYAELYDFAPVGYCTLDPAGCVSEINLTGAEMLGKRRARVIGKPFALYLPESDRAAFRAHVHRRLTSPRGPAVVELTLVSPGRQPIVIQMVSTVAVDQAGAVVGCRSAFTDITEQKRAETALQLAVHMREEFLAIVSHDLRNPLNVVALSAEILKGCPTLDAQSLGQVDHIFHAITQMTRMLSDLLDLSSMDAGHLSMERKLEGVDALLSAAVEGARPAAAARSIRLETSFEALSLVAYCDRDRILQVLMNLIGNAIKFSRADSEVRIETRRTGEQTEFAVRDSGAGMSKSQLDHIFDPYWQAPTTAKQGTGLGLSIARGIVEFHGGRIWAESVLDRGSCFLFTLPCASDYAEEAAVEVRPLRAGTRSGPLSGMQLIVTEQVEVPRLAGGTILIVDDELATRTLLAELLETEGYDVVTAADGIKALEYLRATTTLPYLILLDLVMPNMDGWQFIEARSHERRFASIPVVLISGQLNARETARSLGLESYIEKPIAMASLREVLARVRDRGASDRTTSSF
ncbi:MAG: ATP-binding protein [Kofleriaceae bacterium]